MRRRRAWRGGGGSGHRLTSLLHMKKSRQSSSATEDKIVKYLRSNYDYTSLRRLQSILRIVLTKLHPKKPLPAHSPQPPPPPYGEERSKKILKKPESESPSDDDDDGAASTATTEAEALVAGGGEKARFRDFGGMEDVISDLEREVLLPLHQPELPRVLGIRPQLGLLLHGPPGCGKTRLAQAIANEADVPMYTISGPELISGVSGASEENIRDIFSKARRTAPCVIFIDEIDAIASKRENLQREMEKRIVTQLMICMDDSNTIIKPIDANSESKLLNSAPPSHILVIGATNRPEALDSALRRPGRFDREIELRVPDEKARVEILSVLCKKLKLEGSIDLHKIARATPGFVGADLAASVNKAGNLAMTRIAEKRKSRLYKDNLDEEHDRAWLKEPFSPKELDKLAITMQDFEEAVKLVQPSSKREGFSAIPNVKWEDVGGLDFLRQEFDRYIVRRIKYPEVYEVFLLEW